MVRTIMVAAGFRSHERGDRDSPYIPDYACADEKNGNGKPFSDDHYISVDLFFHARKSVGYPCIYFEKPGKNPFKKPQQQHKERQAMAVPSVA